MYYRILSPETIQLSDHYIDGYSQVIVDEKPTYDRTTHHLQENYAIVQGEVHKTWVIVEGEEELTDNEALSIITAR